MIPRVYAGLAAMPREDRAVAHKEGADIFRRVNGEPDVSTLRYAAG